MQKATGLARIEDDDRRIVLDVLGVRRGSPVVIREPELSNEEPALSPAQSPPTSKSIDWYAEGQSRTVEVEGVQITIRFIGRKGRRGRIAIEAPSGAVFQSAESRLK
jgi:hypothetical protein